jgi:hypothetical protein
VVAKAMRRSKLLEFFASLPLCRVDGLVICLNNPFRGETSIGPEIIERARCNIDRNGRRLVIKAEFHALITEPRVCTHRVIAAGNARQIASWRRMTGQRLLIVPLRPTQMTPGHDEVASRAAKIADMEPPDLEALLKKKPIPCVLGPRAGALSSWNSMSPPKLRRSSRACPRRKICQATGADARGENLRRNERSRFAKSKPKQSLRRPIWRSMAPRGRKDVNEHLECRVEGVETKPVS